MDYMIKKDKELIIKAYKQFGRHAIYDNHLSIKMTEMLWLIDYDIKAIEYIGYDLRKSDEFYLEVAKINPKLLKKINGNKDKNLMINCIKANSSCFSYLPEFVRKDRDIVLEVARIDGRELIHSFFFENDEEIAYEAIKSNGMALEAFGHKIRDNEEYVKLAVSKSPWALQYASNRFKDNKEIIEMAIKQNGSTLIYASDRLKDNKGLAKKAVTSNPFAFQFVSDRLKDDEEIAYLAISKEILMYKYISDRLKKKFSIKKMEGN
jgi:hypothetical protein